MRLFRCQDARYMVLTPKSIQSCAPYSFSARAFGNHSYTLKAELQRSYSGNTISSITTEILPGDTNTVTLQVPCNLTSWSIYLILTGTGETTFNNRQYLSVNSRNMEIIIQTDKKVYKPGQTVKYRVFGVRSDLQVVCSNYTVTVTDPKRNKIHLYTSAGDDYCIIERDLKLPKEPIFGAWKIKATVKKMEHTQTFKIEKYARFFNTLTHPQFAFFQVLPKAEAKVIMPYIVSQKDKSITVQVSSQYTFGKPVNGSARLRIIVNYYPKRKYQKDPDTGKYGYVDLTQPELIYDMQLDKNGKGTTVITTEKLKTIAYGRYLSYKTIIGQVNVTDDATGATYISQTSQISVTRTREKLSFVLNPQNYKPALVNRFYIELKQMDGKPVLEPGNIIVSSRVKILIPEEPATEPPPPSENSDNSSTPTPPTTPRWRYGHYGWGYGRYGYPPWWYDPNCKDPQYRYENLPEKNLTVPANGLVTYDLLVNETDSVEVYLKVYYVEDTDVYTSRTLTSFKSPSNTFLSVSLKTNKPASGKKVELELKATREFSRVYYTILSRGVLITENHQDFSTTSKSQILSFSVTSDMAPKLKIIVFIRVEDKEIVADAISFNVEGFFYNNKVSLMFDSDKVETGSISTLSVKAYRNSNVYAVAVDKSTTLLGEASDDFSQEVKEFLDKVSSRNYYRKKREALFRKRSGSEKLSRTKRSVWWPYAYTTSGTDVDDIFRYTGLNIISDALVYKYQAPELCRRFYAYPAGTSATEGPQQLPPGQAPDVASRNFDEEVSARSFFPETWIWESQNAGSTGIANFTLKVPDTITTWVASAFAISPNPSIGVGMTSDVAELTAFREFFVMLNLPYSVVRGEELVIKASVFNYLGFDTEAEVMLGNPKGFVIIQVDADGFEVESMVTETTRINVPKDGAATAYFTVRFLEVGYIDLQVYARTVTLQAGDRILKPMFVEVEGISQEYNEVVIVDLVEQNYFNRSVEIRYPSNVVPDSQKVVVTAYGDPLSSALQDIEKWIKRPYGCGEQNMINFVPNIYIWAYLHCTGQLTPAIQTKIKNYLEIGYSGEMRYQRNDYSFSAFGDGDSSGSQWLTAYVVRTFSEARQYIYVDEKILEYAVNYLINNQNEDGTFNEPGRVFSKALKGSSFEGNGLNAFTLIALSEVSEIMQGQLYFANSMYISIQQLETACETMTNIYDLAITAYALYVVGSTKSSNILQKLESLQTTEDGMVYWEVVIEADRVQYYWNPPHKQSSPVNIETAAYVLLTYSKMGEKEKGIPIMKWLLSQQNSNGGYSSTQAIIDKNDTVVALQALSQFACLLHGGSYDITLNVFACRQSRTWTISQSSSLFKWETRETTDSIDIEASGTGSGIVMITVKYNIEELVVQSTWGLSVVTESETLEVLVIKVCFDWKVLNQSSGMAILETVLISGFRVDDSQLQNNKLIKRMESDQRKFTLYFDEVGNTPMCLKLRLVKGEVVGKVKPGFVTITDYYNPENSATVSYKSSIGENAPVCALCPQGVCGECKVGKKR
ncbi:hypothetical protein LOTGIDRAFT_231162 [Lottia gigantea]|uniref:CD109 antigen n=1 Tax=Lottia gigantea TaxID=225164 RepID=V4A4C2_LOTGI|nr:hypothetical protein LOTGIDRAFT_231162 [Lottia gigantea]ESO98768.1 hypothetical protein LOTGIDRAFT_231162 [Lottia gigantea]